MTRETIAGMSPHPVLDDLIERASMGVGLAADAVPRRRGDDAASPHPRLDQLVAWGREEYGSPAYVDAVIRNFSQTSLVRLYDIVGCETSGYKPKVRTATLRHSWRFAMGFPLRGDVTYAEACSMVSRRILDQSGVSRVRYQRVVDALLAPILEVSDRRWLTRAMPGFPTPDWGLNARTLRMPDNRASRTLLRLCLMPHDTFAEGMSRLGVDLPLLDEGLPLYEPVPLVQVVADLEDEGVQDDATWVSRANEDLLAPMGALA